MFFFHNTGRELITPDPVDPGDHGDLGDPADPGHHGRFLSLGRSW